MHKIIPSITTILSVLFCQQAVIEKIDIESKQNGIAVNFYSDNKIKSSQITGWYNPSTSCSYITIYNSKGSEKDLNESAINGDVSSIEIIQLNESLQVGIRSKKYIEQFEFYNDPKDSTIVALLRYPIEEILAYASKNDVTLTLENQAYKQPISIKRALYILTTLFLIGIMTN